jgi:hypothetical protein
VNKKLKQELKTAFNAPTPSKKNEFLSHLSYPKTSNTNFFFSQMGYIRKRFWGLSALATIALILFIQAFDAAFKTVVILSSFFPFLVVLSVAEISKSSSYNMAEMEISCKYNLSKITLVRLSLIGSFHFILLFFMVMIFANSSEYSFLQFALYSITPLLLCDYLSLYISNHFHTKDIVYICAGVAGMVSMSIFLLTNNFEMIYSRRFVLFWCLVFIFMLISLVKEIKDFIKQSEELQWNSPLID